MLATQIPGPAAPSRLLGAPAAELKFRIQGGEHQGRILRIAAAKCTIGSAPGCTLRLRGGDIEPLHCLILAGRNGTIIRRNSPRTYLNGGPFEDAALQTGDVLRVGSIELVVVECPQAAGNHRPRPVQESAETGYHKQVQQRLAAELAVMGEQLLAAREQLEQARQGNAEAADEHTRSVNQVREQYTQALESFRSRQREERAESLAREEQLQRELCQAQQSAKELESRLTEQEVAFQQQAENHRQEVLKLQQAMSADQHQREQERAALSAERQQLVDKLAALENELRQQQSELARRQEASDKAAEQVRILEGLLQETRRQAEERQQSLEVQQRSREEFTAIRSRLEDSLSTLSEQLRQRVAELAAAQQRGEECTGALNEQLADLTARLVEREKELAHRDSELAELRQRAAHFSAADQMVRQLEESLMNSNLAQQAERETRQKERCELESQATLALESTRRCEALERQLAELRSNLDQVVAKEAAEHVEQEQAAQQYEEQVERWQSEAHQWRLQAEEVAGQLGEAKQLCMKLETGIAELKGAAPAADVAAEPQPIEDLRTQLETQRQELVEARTQFQEEQTQLGRRLAETSSREEVLARFEGEFRERQAAWEAARSEQASALEERSQLIASQIAQFEAEQAAFARQQATIIQQMSSLEDRVQELTTAGESRATNSPFVIPRLDDSSLRGELKLPEQPGVRAAPSPEVETRIEDIQLPETPPASVVAEVAPPEHAAEPSAAEANSLVNRLMQVGLWKGNESDSQESAVASVEEPAPEKPIQEKLAGMTVQPGAAVLLPEMNAGVQTAGKHVSKGSDRDDDSIEHYMARLLSRVRGGESPAADSHAVGAAQPAIALPAQASASALARENSSDPQQYVPRTPAPEQLERLSVMRELANCAADSAIQAHARQRQKRKTKNSSLVALLSLVGSACLFIVAGVNRSPLSLCGSAIFLAICCIMSLRAIAGGFRQMRMRGPVESCVMLEVETNTEQVEPE